VQHITSCPPRGAARPTTRCISIYDAERSNVQHRVQPGEDITITVSGRPVALLTAVAPQRRRRLAIAEFLNRLPRAHDPGLRDDLAILAGNDTDDLGPIE
jgi:prevent-host-death family protein